MDTRVSQFPVDTGVITRNVLAPASSGINQVKHEQVEHMGFTPQNSQIGASRSPSPLGARHFQHPNPRRPDPTEPFVATGPKRARSSGWSPRVDGGVRVSEPSLRGSRLGKRGG